MTEIIETNVGIRCQMCGVVNWPTALACMNCTTTLDKRPARAMFSYSTLGAMSFSQKVARFFEIADYLLLTPAIVGLLFSLMIVGNAPWFTLIIAVSFAAGCYLLIGFFRHSRGRLNDSEISRLWYATIVYNFIDLIATLLIAGASRDEFFYLYSLWPLLVIILSAMALSRERQRIKLNY
ncbi:MAG TPA: hypothetical protein VF658_14205 [Pyrinomonadaceae bacterium]|jgi:hypothetical protein